MPTEARYPFQNDINRHSDVSSETLYGMTPANEDMYNSIKMQSRPGK